MKTVPALQGKYIYICVCARVHIYTLYMQKGESQKVIVQKLFIWSIRMWQNSMSGSISESNRLI